MNFFNWAYFKEPYNWAIIFIVTAFVLLFFQAVSPDDQPSAKS